eukprot:scaffold21628_cov71-Isochrysis_galbana.AAC.2
MSCLPNSGKENGGTENGVTQWRHPICDTAWGYNHVIIWGHQNGNAPLESANGKKAGFASRPITG